MKYRVRSLALAVLLAGAARTAYAAGPITFDVTPDTLRADSAGVWRASLRVHNQGEWGLYPDSLNLEWKSLDDEVSAAPRAGLTSLTTLMHVMTPAGVGDVTGIDWTAPADFERGTLTFHAYLHDAQKKSYALERTVTVSGNDLFDRFPRTLVDVGGRKVELIHVPATSGEAPAPGIVYVPPAGVSARLTLRWANQFAARGIAVTLVSLPGTGGSTGRSDRAGPVSVAAVEAALARLAKQPGVDARRLAVWGLADGGTSALLVAAKHPELQGIIAQNAEYDPWRAYRALAAAEQEKFVAAVGRDSASWRARAAGLVAQRISAPVLVLHSAGMGEGSTAAAEAFLAARVAKDLPVESRIEGGASAATVTRRDAVRVAADFLSRRFRK